MIEKLFIHSLLFITMQYNNSFVEEKRRKKIKRAGTRELAER